MTTNIPADDFLMDGDAEHSITFRRDGDEHFGDCSCGETIGPMDAKVGVKLGFVIHQVRST